MKKKFAAIIIALLTLCSSQALMAQSKFRYGPAAGVTFSTLKFRQDLFTVDQSTGFSAGVQAEFMFPGIGFGLGLGLMYNQLGATLHLGEQKIWSSQGYGKERSYLHYVEIPFHLKFKYTRLNGFEDKLAPIVYGGPTFGLHVGNSNIPALKYAGGDLGMTLGIGVEILRNWQLTGSYTWGMTYVEKARLLTDFSARSYSWDIRVAYYF